MNMCVYSDLHLHFNSLLKPASEGFSVTDIQYQKCKTLKSSSYTFDLK